MGKLNSKEEDFKGYEIFLSGDVQTQFGVNPNALNHASDELFPAFKRPGSKFWRIPDTAQFREWLEGYKYRPNVGRAPNPAIGSLKILMGLIQM